MVEQEIIDKEDETQLPTLTGWEKIRILIIILVFLAIAVLGALDCITLSGEIIIALAIAAVLFLFSIISKYIVSIKVGDFELTLKEQKQTQKFVEDLNVRVAKLEEILIPKDQEQPPQYDLALVAGFEEAAVTFKNRKPKRVLADKQMAFIGVKLGKDFLLDKLKNGKHYGEKAGAATALGTLADPDVLDDLIEAFDNRSSFVRYRVARAIRNLAPGFSPFQIDKAIEFLESRAPKESNAPTRRMIQRAISTLRNI